MPTLFDHFQLTALDPSTDGLRLVDITDSIVSADHHQRPSFYSVQIIGLFPPLFLVCPVPVRVSPYTRMVDKCRLELGDTSGGVVEIATDNGEEELAKCLIGRRLHFVSDPGVVGPEFQASG